MFEGNMARGQNPGLVHDKYRQNYASQNYGNPFCV